MDTNQLREFFGYCTVVNIGILFVTFLAYTHFKAKITALHSKVYGISAESVGAIYLNYFGVSKILVIVFSLSPYVALVLLQR